MVFYKELKRMKMGHLCRECLNCKYRLKLKRKDCIYDYYMGKCACCGEMKHIVIGITWASRWKLLFGKK